MSETSRRQASWEDILTTPADDRSYEVLAGQLEAQPRPRPRHNRAQGQIYARLSGPFDPGDAGPGGWWLLIEPDVRLGTQTSSLPTLRAGAGRGIPAFPSYLRSRSSRTGSAR